MLTNRIRIRRLIMYHDPIVAEIRKIRDAHTKAFNYNLVAICKDHQAKHALCIELMIAIKEKKSSDIVMRLRNKLQEPC